MWSKASATSPAEGKPAMACLAPDDVQVPKRKNCPSRDPSAPRGRPSRVRRTTRLLMFWKSEITYGRVVATGVSTVARVQTVL